MNNPPAPLHAILARPPPAVLRAARLREPAFVVAKLLETAAAAPAFVFEAAQADRIELALIVLVTEPANATVFVELSRDIKTFLTVPLSFNDRTVRRPEIES